MMGTGGQDKRGPEVHAVSAEVSFAVSAHAFVRVVRGPGPYRLERFRLEHFRSFDDAVIFLVDADNKDERRGEVETGFAGCGMPHAWGVARKVVEAWLIADADLLSPIGFDTQGRKPAKLGGNEAKRILETSMEAADVKTLHDAIDRWSLSRAAPNSPSLREFCVRVVDLLRDRSLCRPISWSPSPDAT